MLFHEIYGRYYRAVAEILGLAVEGRLTEKELERVARQAAFSESALTIVPALKGQDWQLLTEGWQTPLTHPPAMPTTSLEKRWMKAISLDPRFRLFGVEAKGLEGVEPLFRPEDVIAYDRYADGDPYEDEGYIRRFRVILRALREGRKLSLRYEDRRGGEHCFVCMPQKLEYSEKDDKFRLLTSGCRAVRVVNLSRILACDMLEETGKRRRDVSTSPIQSLTLELIGQRNALERVMLHFAHFQKEAERLPDNRYRVKILYQRDDETELVIRVLSYGPLVKVVEPAGFIDLIKERLRLQQACALL